MKANEKGDLLDRYIAIRDLIYIASIFILVQFLGLLTAFYISYPPIYYISMVQSNQVNLILLFAEIIIATLIVMLIFRFYKGNMLFVLFEAVSVFFPIFYLFLLVISKITNNAYIDLIVPLVFSLGIIYLKNKRQSLRNIIVILASIGIGIVLPLFITIEVAYLFVLLIAIYDYVSVFITRHMIYLAKYVTEKNLSFFVSSSSLVLMKKGKKKQKVKISKELKPYVKGNIPYISQVSLGAGDLAVPLVFSIAVFYNSLNYFMTMFAISGSIIGMLITLYILNRYKLPLPAIPPIFAGINLGLSAYYAFINARLSFLFLLVFIFFLLLIIYTVKRLTSH